MIIQDCYLKFCLLNAELLCAKCKDLLVFDYEYKIKTKKKKDVKLLKQIY